MAGKTRLSNNASEIEKTPEGGMWILEESPEGFVSGDVSLCRKTSMSSSRRHRLLIEISVLKGFGGHLSSLLHKI